MLRVIALSVSFLILAIIGLGMKSTETMKINPGQESRLEETSTSTNHIKTETVATTTKDKTAEIKPVATTSPKVVKKIIPVVKSQATTTITNTTPEKPQIPSEETNAFVRKAIVNILCSIQSNVPISPISGSGVVISDNGVILTNAHIGQYFLLKDFNGQKGSVSCVIRTGNPAYPKYTAELVYVSSSWISQNKTILIEQNPKGTGEHDFSFLRITGKIDKTELDKFDFLPVNLSEEDMTGDYVLLASYPAGFLGGQSILQNLFQTSAITTIKKIYTFKENTADLISVPGTVVSQKGSSGGAIVNGKGELIGIISTSSEGDQTSERNLMAITPAYINRDLQEESNQSISDILSFPTEYAKSFNEKIATKLTEILTNAILKK